MRVLLGLAVFAATLVSPAQAQNFSTATFGASNAGRWVTTPPQSHHRGRSDVRIHRGSGVAYGYGYGGYEDYGDYDANRSFDPEKWNDWWHDRPDRAYPHWMSHNADCARRWYAGDVLTC